MYINGHQSFLIYFFFFCLRICCFQVGGGGAIYNSRDRMELEGCSFKDNKATSGDGGALGSVNDIVVTDSVFEDNIAFTGVWTRGGGGGYGVSRSMLSLCCRTMQPFSGVRE